MKSVLKSFYKRFHGSPARRADYIEITDSNTFPKKFCSVRWVENPSVVQRALDIYNNIKKYVEKSKLPSNFTIKTVKESVADPSTPCRVIFFINIASALEPFLRHFQSDAPLVPFLYQQLEVIKRNLMQKFIKREALLEATSVRKLMKTDLNEKKCHYKEIRIGTATSSMLEKVKVSDGKKIEFRKDCISYLVRAVSKLKERSPSEYRIVRALSSLSPQIIYSSPNLGRKRF